MIYETLNVRFEEKICFIQIFRPDDNNTINEKLIKEFKEILNSCKNDCNIIVLEGLPEVFCFGADFNEIKESIFNRSQPQQNPESMYELWQDLASGPYITIAHVRGRANAGGMGFVAACDLVLADHTAVFSLSELLFGVFPACVFPFLVRKIGLQKAHYMTLSTQPIPVEKAHNWGLVDAYERESDKLLHKLLLRLKLLSKEAIKRYKSYVNKIYNSLEDSKSLAISANIEAFSDNNNIEGIINFVETGEFPWEKI